MLSLTCCADYWSLAIVRRVYVAFCFRYSNAMWDGASSPISPFPLGDTSNEVMHPVRKGTTLLYARET